MAEKLKWVKNDNGAWRANSVDEIAFWIIRTEHGGSYYVFAEHPVKGNKLIDQFIFIKVAFMFAQALHEIEIKRGLVT
jgi:hypothetical protein